MTLVFGTFPGKDREYLYTGLYTSLSKTTPEEICGPAGLNFLSNILPVTRDIVTQLGRYLAPSEEYGAKKGLFIKHTDYFNQ